MRKRPQVLFPAPLTGGIALETSGRHQRFSPGSEGNSCNQASNSKDLSVSRTTPLELPVTFVTQSSSLWLLLFPLLVSPLSDCLSNSVGKGLCHFSLAFAKRQNNMLRGRGCQACTYLFNFPAVGSHDWLRADHSSLSSGPDCILSVPTYRASLALSSLGLGNLLHHTIHRPKAPLVDTI